MTELHKECRYCRKVWLNDDDCEATGSVVAFDGNVERHAGRIESTTFLEVADCNKKVLLHQMHGANERQKFISKLKKLARVANRFAEYLEYEDHKEKSCKQLTSRSRSESTTVPTSRPTTPD